MGKVPATITGCILARNEAHRIEAALQSLQGWTAQIIVIDNESDDATAAVARRYTEHVLSAPRAANFDAARNLAIEPAVGGWLFYLDADERVPPRLGPTLQRLVEEEGDQFEALLLPFKHFFCGKWMEHSGWWPGYTRPQLMKKGCFRYNPRLHTGAEVQGRTRLFPADDPDLAILHYSYDDLEQYLTKLNRYTSGEAESLLADGRSHAWQGMLAHFVNDWQAYYERGRADLDGMHGFVLSFMSAFYRFSARAKLWDLRRQQGEADPHEPVPADLPEMLRFMAEVAERGATPWLQLPHTLPPNTQHSTSNTPTHPAVWNAPLFDPSGYADEARNFVLGLLAAGEELVLQPQRWGTDDPGLLDTVRETIAAHTVAEEAPCELRICQTLPALIAPSPQARFNIARTMFETDRLPGPWVEQLNRMDRVWVPSRFNRDTFVQSGVDPAKVVVVPGCLDPAPFTAEVEPWPLPGAETFRFLTVFDWSRHKGWDVLLEAFVQEFGDEPSVGLVIKTWSTNHYTLEDIRIQADTHLRQQLGRGLNTFPNLHLWWETLPSAEMPRLYRAVDCFVLPTRGEGWGRPLMEAMAAGLPTIATAWSGLTQFHNEAVGYPLEYRLVPVPPEGAREIPVYTGHCWAEPDVTELRRLMREVVNDPEAARERGAAAQRHIATRYSRQAVTKLLQTELAQCRELAKSKPAPASPPHPAPTPGNTSSPGTTVRPNSEPGTENSELGTRNSELRTPKANPLVREPAAPVDFHAALGRPLRVRWEGDQALLSSLALVNRELCLGLLAPGDVELSLGERTTPWHALTPRDNPRLEGLFARRDAVLSGPPDVTIRHHFPPCWGRPPSGKLVVIQPWEYGHLPVEWVRGAIRNAEEVWAYSRWVRDVYVRSGVQAEKVRVVPLGFNPRIFSPEGPHFPLRTEKQVKFLFVGGALDRKGADLLLAAYQRAFQPGDDVALIVKDMGTQTFYRGATFGEAFRQAQSDPRSPEVCYLDQDLTEVELAALYRSCTCVVQPYRGEGFALPPLEGMACGRMPIVTAGGPTDDYVDDAHGIRLPYRKRLAGGTIGGTFPCAGDPWQLEPDLGALIGALRWVYEHPEEARRKGESAASSVRSAWSWEAAANLARHRLWEVVIGSQARAVVPAQPWQSGEAK